MLEKRFQEEGGVGWLRCCCKFREAGELKWGLGCLRGAGGGVFGDLDQSLGQRSDGRELTGAGEERHSVSTSDRASEHVFRERK